MLWQNKQSTHFWGGIHVFLFFIFISHIKDADLGNDIITTCKLQFTRCHKFRISNSALKAMGVY